MPTIIYSDEDDDHKTIRLGPTPILIGRGLDCHIRTRDARVSRRHASIRWDGTTWLVEDAGSANGVFVGLERVKRAALRNGDIITCGGLVLRMVFDRDEEEDDLRVTRPRQQAVDEPEIVIADSDIAAPPAATRETVRFSVLERAHNERAGRPPSSTQRSTRQWSQQAARQHSGEDSEEADVLGPQLAQMLTDQSAHEPSDRLPAERPATPRPPTIERPATPRPASMTRSATPKPLAVTRTSTPRPPSGERGSEARRPSEPELGELAALIDEASREIHLHLEVAREDLSRIAAPTESLTPLAATLERASQRLELLRSHLDKLYRLASRYPGQYPQQ